MKIKKRTTSHFAFRVVVEKIAVQERLHKTTAPADPIDISAVHVSQDPIQNVEKSIQPHADYKLARHVFDVAVFL